MKTLVLLLAVFVSFSASAVTVNPVDTPTLEYACNLPFPADEVIATHFDYRATNETTWTIGGVTQNPTVCFFLYDLNVIADGNYVFRSFYQYSNGEVSPYSELAPVTIVRHIELPPITDVVLTPK